MNQDSSSHVCGLDFGTSNSEIGILRDGAPSLADVENGRPRIPTTIFFDDTTRDEVFGEAAIARFLEGQPGRMLWAIKSVLGTALQGEATIVRGRRMAFEEIITRILRNLKSKGDAAAGRELTHVVLGRPVHFNDSDPALDRAAEEILRRSARAAGFTHVEMELEPIAAGLELETHIEREQIAAVVDIGGGTSDFTVIRLSPAAQHPRVSDRERILAVGGIHIGGTDFDRQLSVAELMPHLGLGASYRNERGDVLQMPQWVFHDLASWLRINFIYDTRMLDGIYDILARNKDDDRRLARLDKVLAAHLGHTLAREVERTKIALTADAEVTTPLDWIERRFGLTVTRAELNAAIAGLLDDAIRELESVLRASGVRNDAIDVVFFTEAAPSCPRCAGACGNCCRMRRRSIPINSAGSRWG
ncbi:MAG TPA: Hsp70 family protein [Thermoanaerobaculia bacterium]